MSCKSPLSQKKLVNKAETVNKGKRHNGLGKPNGGSKSGIYAEFRAVISYKFLIPSTITVLWL